MPAVNSNGSRKSFCPGSGFALAERHQLTPDLPAALAVYGELLSVAESFEDSPDVQLLRGHLLFRRGHLLLDRNQRGQVREKVRPRLHEEQPMLQQQLR